MSNKREMERRRRRVNENGEKGDVIISPLFERKAARGRSAYKLFSFTIFIGICLIWVYRILHVPGVEDSGRFMWLGMFMCELVFGFYWIFTQSLRFNVVSYYPFKHTLQQRYEEKMLPDVDIFVCTADYVLEPPVMVINTVLSLMSFNYPPEKLSIYLSDDGGSEFTFHALYEAVEFSKHWLPFCRRYRVEPRSPAAYFSRETDHVAFTEEWFRIKKLYDDMKSRIEASVEKGGISEQVKEGHKGFGEWNSKITKQDHQAIVQILIDSREEDAVDGDGQRLPTLVYMSREKRAGRPHKFKAGAMNALIRISSEISNAPIILNVDCDMYLNDPDAIRDALCFFLDEREGHGVAYVQHPQRFHNITKNDLYSNSMQVIFKIEMPGLGGYDTAIYSGTGCFHRRRSLCGQKYSRDFQDELIIAGKADKDAATTVAELEEAAKIVTSCTYEDGTTWGKEKGLVYGCPVEDVVTGLTIQCRGWKSIYYDPDKYAFTGIAPSTLDLALIQYKRWCEGLFQIFISRYCPFLYGRGKIRLGAQMGYCVYFLWPIMSFPTLFYATVPSLSMINHVPLFPKVSSWWILPFAYAFLGNQAYSLAESVSCGETVKAWWNMQRMVLIRRVTSYLFAGVDTVIRQLGFSQDTFALTAKVVDEGAMKRYEEEVMEFGSSLIMFKIISTVAVLNLFSMVWGICRFFLLDAEEAFETFAELTPHMILTGLLVLLNLPVYEALFLRRDAGKIPSEVMFKSVVIASVVCLIPMYYC